MERKFEGGRLVKEKREDEVDRDFEQISDATAATPFSLEGADEYNYEILARDLPTLLVHQQAQVGAASTRLQDMWQASVYQWWHRVWVKK